MVNYTSDFHSILNDFKKNNIPTDNPGFYDNQHFIKIENQNPKYLNNYARFVQLKPYKQDYLIHAEAIVSQIAHLLHNELVKDGRIGACIDVCMVFSRMLENEGIWNYLAQGALTLNFDYDLSMDALYFWPIDFSNANAAHVWVVAPPFNVVDISIKQQPYENQILQWLPDFVFERELNPSNALVSDLASPEARVKLPGFAGDNQNLNPIFAVAPDLKDFFQVFPSNLVNRGPISLKYIPCTVTASDQPFENVTSLELNGRYGLEIYNDIIRPAIHDS